VRGRHAVANAPPDLLFEVPHGATLARHFDELRAELAGDYDPTLREFFFVNTDVGAPELALAVARRFVAERPSCSALVVRCLLPRTFVDCNRDIHRSTVAAASRPGELTPGLPPWIVDAGDRELLLDRCFAYRDVVTAACAEVSGRGGLTVCTHSYAPRSIDVAVDGDIVTSLRAAYAPDRIGQWALRPEVDLIVSDPDGRILAAPQLIEHVEREFAAAGIEVKQNHTYSLHPSTLAHSLAERYPGRTLCLEVRRDLLVEFVPFVELVPRPADVERIAVPLGQALLRATPAGTS
jgi:hypothetical protein